MSRWNGKTKINTPTYTHKFTCRKCGTTTYLYPSFAESPQGRYYHEGRGKEKDAANRKTEGRKAYLRQYYLDHRNEMIANAMRRHNAMKQ